VTPLRFISDVVARPFVCTMAQLLVLLAARNYINGLISLIVAALISVLVFGLCALFVAMTTDERRALFALAAPGVSFFRQLFQIAPKGLK
jgi:hypothetical protein